MELSRQMLLLTAVNYGSYYLHITKGVKIYADTNKNLGDNINGKIQQF